MPILQIDPVDDRVVRTEEIVPDDLKLDEFVLEIARATSSRNYIKVRDVVMDAVLERTMEGASNLRVTLYDPLGLILNSGAFDRAVDIFVDDLWWRLVAVNKADSELDLVFEDRDVTMIRKHTEVVRGNRKNMTRAEFCVSLLKRVKTIRVELTTKNVSPLQANRNLVTVVCPELYKTQPKQKGKKVKDEIRDRRREAGLFNTGDNLYVWYSQGSSSIPRDSGVANNPQVGAWPFTVKKPTKEQLQNAEELLDECAREKVPRKLWVAALATAMAESSLINRTKEESDRDSEGLFQQRASQGWTGLRDIPKATKEFLSYAIKYHKEYPNASIGELACRVQMNNAVISWVVDKINSAATFAEKWVDAYGEVPLNLIAYRKKFVFSTENNGKKEDWWTAIGRLMEDVGWARFMSNGVIYLIAESDLLKSKIRMRLSEKTPGVNTINFDYDIGKTLAQATVKCRASRWVAPPGSVVELVDCGPASGRWLVSSIRRSLLDRDAEIQLKKPTRKLSEPQADLVIREGSDDFWTNPRSRGQTPMDAPSGGFPDNRSGGFSQGGVINPITDRGATGKVLIPDWVQGPLAPDFMTFMKLVAGATSETVSLTSARRPTDSDSNHCRGGAADISVDGNGEYNERSRNKGDNISIAILRVCGYSYGEAKRLVVGAGGTADRGWNLGQGGKDSNGNFLRWRGYSVEVGWRTPQFGGHWDHIHVGFEGFKCS